MNKIFGPNKEMNKIFEPNKEMNKIMNKNFGKRILADLKNFDLE
jgi:hypothetical protein